MGILGALVVAMAVQAGPVEVKAAPVFNPSLCAKKRVDSCGCHHVYGVRHCHSKRQSEHCEGMVQADPASSSESSQGDQLIEFLFQSTETARASHEATATR